MKPTDRYIEWLQANPGVCKELEKHELECWDFFMWEGDVYVVTAVGCNGVYANKHDGGVRSWFNTKEDLTGRSLWLPTLGQLVRMLDDAGCEEFWMHFHMQGRTVAWLPSGVNDEYKDELPPQGMEPEIACTALWASDAHDRRSPPVVVLAWPLSGQAPRWQTLPELSAATVRNRTCPSNHPA